MTSRHVLTVAPTLDPFRERIVKHSEAFTVATLAFAKATLDPQAAAVKERAAVLRALARWQADVDQAQRRVKRLRGSTRGRTLALRWLARLADTLVHFHDGLALADVAAAADAGRLTEIGMTESHRLEAELDAVLS